MGLFGALFAGVSGLDSQSNKIGIISNNISNVNTVGFKQGQASFDTLVVPSGTTSFSPGGVIGANQQLVNQQGLISATTSPTDIAITGGGMLFVSAAPVAAGQTSNPLFTRSGSFTQDENGNFINANGYFLSGWQINPATGETFPAPQLTTVNVSSSATGKPTPTSGVTFGANFDAGQAALLGPGETISALTGAKNINTPASQIIVGNDVNGEDLNGIVRGDSFTVTSGLADGATKQDTFTYGGFPVGRNVNTTLGTAPAAEAESISGGGLGDGGNILSTEPVAGASITNDGSGGANGTITMTVADSSVYAAPPAGTGTGFAYITGASSVNGIPAADINGEHAVTIVDGTTITFTASNGVLGGGGSGSSATAATTTNRTFAFQGNILDAQSESDDFLGKTTIVPFTTQALNFSIDVGSVGTTTFKYSTNPDPAGGTFNSMDTLVQAINDATGSGLTAQITDGRLYISAANPNNSVTFQNGDAVGTPNSTPPLSGINWVQELDLPPAGTLNENATAPTATTYFNSLASLQTAVNSLDSSNLIATLTNPTGLASLSINEANAQQTIAFADGNPFASPAVVNTGSLLKEFGFQSLQGAAPSFSTGTLAKTYNANSPQTDMSSGAITPQFSKDITIYDSLGNPHVVAINVAKLNTNIWALELTSVPASDVEADNGGGVNGDGQIVARTVTFNGSGELQTVSTELEGSINITWNPKFGANQSSINLNLGQNNTATTTNAAALTQASGAFNVSTLSQNGTPTGELTGVTIDTNGFVIARFSNGQTQKMFQLPLASFTNPDGLLAVSGDAYQATLSSGPINPVAAGTSGVGVFTPSALEQSNVDLSTQLTDLIVAQQAYGANSKVLTIADQLLQQLDQIIQ